MNKKRTSARKKPASAEKPKAQAADEKARNPSTENPLDLHRKWAGPDVFDAAMLSDRPSFQLLRLREIERMLFLPDEMENGEKFLRINAALRSIGEIKPRDEIERMIVVQMVACHNAALECCRRAMIPDQSNLGIDQNLKHMEKLIKTYTDSLQALNKHRGKGQQKVIVEYVHVEAGGQAVVGNVHAGANSGEANRDKPKALTRNEDRPMEMLGLKAKKKAAHKDGAANDDEDPS